MQVNWTLASPRVLVNLYKSPAITKYNISSLKFLNVAGAALKEGTQISVMKGFPDSQIYHGYGANSKIREYKNLKIYLFLYLFIISN